MDLLQGFELGHRDGDLGEQSQIHKSDLHDIVVVSHEHEGVPLFGATLPSVYSRVSITPSW